jgi:hypothetical protein
LEKSGAESLTDLRALVTIAKGKNKVENVDLQYVDYKCMTFLYVYFVN